MELFNVSDYLQTEPNILLITEQITLKCTILNYMFKIFFLKEVCKLPVLMLHGFKFNATYLFLPSSGLLS